MVFPVVGGTQDTGAYEIDNSLRFNDGDSARLTLDPGTSTNNKKCTLSFWAKIGVPTSNGTDYFFSNHADANNRCRVHISNTGEFAIFGKSSGSTFIDLYTNARYRDSSAWYHFLVRVDSTDGTANNRLKLYVNGTLQTDVTQGTNPDQNADVILGSQDNMTIGAGHSGSAANSNPYDGYLAEMHFLDGTAYDASYFGEFNDNGVWIPKKYTGGNYGTNGFYMEFKQTGTSANSSGIGADTSGNDNHFTPTNLAATDVTTDTPTNNFITWNALNHTGASLQEGNTFTETRNSSDYDAGAMGNIGLTRGKWYWELKITAVGSHTYAGIINIGNRFDMADEDYDTTSGGTDGYPIYDYMELGKRGSNTGSGRSETGVVQATYGDGDILNFALDLDNNKIHYGKNGTYGESSDPANNTNGIAISDGVYYTPVVVGYGSGDIHANFGQPAFSISSGNADANGHGNFEYAPPSGFFSICTKNLAETG